MTEPFTTAWKDPHRSVSGHRGAYAMREIVRDTGREAGCPDGHL
ncbi:hypothetical protein AB0K93_03680 [Streptomyces sp. NPDC052676]